MILLSLLLVLVSLGLLIAGLAGASKAEVWASILSSLVAGMFLTFAVLRQRAPDIDVPDIDKEDEGPPDAADGMDEVDPGMVTPHHPGSSQPAAAGKAAPTEPTAIGAQDEDYSEPPDEPPEEDVSASDALRVVELAAEVLVVDGRPRYHLSNCPHLTGREAVPLPVPEARDSGFTPCALCQPDARLVEQARTSTASQWTTPEAPRGGSSDPGPGRGPVR